MSQGLSKMLQSIDGNNIEMRIAYQCAPLLAGLKPSNLLMLRSRELVCVQHLLKKAGISYFIVAGEGEGSSSIIQQKTA